MPVSEENEAVLKGKVPKANNQDKQNSDDDMPVNAEDIKMGLNGDIERQFKMLGFTDAGKVPRHHFVSGVDVVLPMRGTKNERAFAALVAEMIETNKVMIGKIIERKNADPKLVGLFPHINKKRPLLYLAQLPTAEDLRDYQFPSLVASTNA